MAKSRDVFPVKTSQHIAGITGYSVRTVEYWLSEKVVIPSDALAELIRSEWGREFLAAVMSDNTSRWWIKMLAWLKRISLEAAQAAQEQRYKEMLDEEANYARANPAAPMFQDDPFFAGQPSPYRSRSRRSHR